MHVFALQQVHDISACTSNAIEKCFKFILIRYQCCYTLTFTFVASTMTYKYEYEYKYKTSCKYFTMNITTRTPRVDKSAVADN